MIYLARIFSQLQLMETANEPFLSLDSLDCFLNCQT